MTDETNGRPEGDGGSSFKPGFGLLKGLGVTLKHALKPAITQQYPHEKPDLPPRTRGVIALKEANCTVCYMCSRECPDWCIYIDAHKESHEPASGGKSRSVKILDKFDIDFALCMYCGICVEVCPFDALFWSPEFEYAEYEIAGLYHDKEKLEEWTTGVLPPPALEEGAEPEPEPEVDEHGGAEASAAPIPSVSAPVIVAAPASAPAPPTALAPEAAAVPPPASAPAPHVEPDQETHDRVLAEELAKGTDARVAEGKAKRAAMMAARKKAGL
ncbi:MAG: NADH-quinone oxidoreductase subunit I [Actinomycetota bacterium]